MKLLKPTSLLAVVLFLAPGTLPAHADLNWSFETGLGVVGSAPDAFIDRFGAVHLVWISMDGTVKYRKVFAGQWPGQGAVPYDASIAEDVPGSEGVYTSDGRPRVAADFDGNPHIVWGHANDPRNGPIYYQTYQDGAWLAQPELVTAGRFNWAYHPDITIASGSIPHVVAVGVNDPGQIGTGPREVLYKVRDAGGQWLPEDSSTASIISDPAVDSSGCGIAVDTEETVHATWYYQFQGLYDLGYRTKEEGAAWGRVTNPVRHNDFVGPIDIAIDKFFNPHFAYPTTFDNFGLRVLEGINYTRFLDLIWRRDDFNRNLINSFPIEPRLALNNQGGCLTWIDTTTLMYHFNTNAPSAERVGYPVPAGQAMFNGYSTVVGRGNRFYFFWPSFLGEISIQGLLVTERAVGPPRILAGGYMDTMVTNYQGGTVTLVVFVDDPNGLRNIQTVELLYGGQPTDTYFVDDGFHGDFAASDGVFGLKVPLTAGIPAGRYPLEVRVTNTTGDQSVIFPYLRISGPTSALEMDWQVRPEYQLKMERWLTAYEAFLRGGGSLDRAAGSKANPDLPPFIMAAGYLGTDLRSDFGGKLTFLAWVSDPNGDTRKVDILAGGLPLGIELKDDGSQGDFSAGDGLFTLEADIPGGGAPGDYLLELQAEDARGEKGGIWPYFNVFPGGTPTPTMTPTPTVTPTPHPGDLTCDGAVLLACGTPYIGETSTGQSRINEYNCPNATFLGREKVHKIAVTSGGLRIDLTNYAPKDLNVLLLRACSENDCVAYGDNVAANHRRINLGFVPEGIYYLVVDGVDPGDYGGYELLVTCGQGSTPTPTPTPFGWRTPTPGPGQLDCTNAVALPCGFIYDGDTAGGSDRVLSYGQCSTISYPGHERVHAIQKSVSGPLTASLSTSTVDLDLFILGTCNALQCLAAGDTTAVLDQAPAGLYYVVVDSPNDTTGTYSLQVTCQ